MAVVLGFVAIGILAAFTVVTRRLAVLRAERQALDLRAASLEKELASARRQTAHAEASQVFLGRFVRELPHVVHELNAGAGGRQIPRLLLGATLRMLEPRKALVAVRRRRAESDPDRHLHLAVAATFPDGLVEVGSEIAIGKGEIGYAAEAQRIMDRRDFESQAPPLRKRLREETDETLLPDIVAPLSFGEELVGVIAVEGAKHCPSEARDALRLLSQVGAVSLQAQAKYKEMKATASIDGLTGVFNKRYLTHRLAEEMRRAVDARSSVSVFIFDVDHFKHYNDRNGHVAGDRLLQRLVRLALDNVRQDTVFGRYGDEEFLAIFPRSNRAQALAAAENIQLAVAAHDFAFGFDQPLGIVSISGGVAECPIDGADAATLVRAADEALYEAKRAGRNRVFAYQPISIGGAGAPAPVSAQGGERADERGAPDGVRAAGEGGAALLREASMPESTEIASDFTPRPGTLFALADITPAAGIPKLTLEPSPEVLAAAVAAAPPLASPPPTPAEVAVEASGRTKGRGAREPGGEPGRDPEAAEAGHSGRP